MDMHCVQGFEAETKQQLFSHMSFDKDNKRKGRTNEEKEEEESKRNTYQEHGVNDEQNGFWHIDTERLNTCGLGVFTTFEVVSVDGSSVRSLFSLRS